MTPEEVRAYDHRREVSRTAYSLLQCYESEQVDYFHPAVDKTLQAKLTENAVFIDALLAPFLEAAELIVASRAYSEEEE